MEPAARAGGSSKSCCSAGEFVPPANTRAGAAGQLPAVEADRAEAALCAGQSCLLAKCLGALRAAHDSRRARQFESRVLHATPRSVEARMRHDIPRRKLQGSMG